MHIYLFADEVPRQGRLVVHAAKHALPQLLAMKSRARVANYSKLFHGSSQPLSPTEMRQASAAGTFTRGAPALTCRAMPAAF